MSSRKSRWAMSKLAFFIRKTTRYPSKSTGWAWVNNFIWFMYFVSSEPSCLITVWRWMMISVERKTPCLTRAVYGLISIRKKCDESVIGIDGHTRNASTGSILNYIPVRAHYYHRLESVQFGASWLNNDYYNDKVDIIILTFQYYVHWKYNNGNCKLQA